MAPPKGTGPTPVREIRQIRIAAFDRRDWNVSRRHREANAICAITCDAAHKGVHVTPECVSHEEPVQSAVPAFMPKRPPSLKAGQVLVPSAVQESFTSRRALSITHRICVARPMPLCHAGRAALVAAGGDAPW